eukprot:399453-Pelagomonas_calceolata.AAC.2
MKQAARQEKRKPRAETPCILSTKSRKKEVNGEQTKHGLLLLMNAMLALMYPRLGKLFWICSREGKNYIAVPACVGSLAEANFERGACKQPSLDLPEQAVHNVSRIRLCTHTSKVISAV